VQFGYGLNYLIDIDNAVIVDVEATPARTHDEVAATKTMLDRTEACFDLKPKRLAADTAYGTGKFLGWLVKEKQITPHIPMWERPKREDGKFSTSDFAGTADAASTSVPTANSSGPAVPCTPTGGSATVPARAIAMRARCELSAPRRMNRTISPATSMRMHAMWLDVR
jgi:hypothetical protein